MHPPPPPPRPLVQGGAVSAIGPGGGTGGGVGGGGAGGGGGGVGDGARGSVELTSALAEAALTSRQCTLLDELTDTLGSSSLGAAGGMASSSTANLVVKSRVSEEDAYDAFYRHWRYLKTRKRGAESDLAKSQWGWINQMQDLCSETCKSLDGLLDDLALLDQQRQEVIRKTTTLHEQCEQMVQDQEALVTRSDALSSKLDYYERVSDVARVLDQPNAASHPDFATTLDHLDGSIEFLELHPDFCQAKAYLHQFEHLRSRAVLAVRSSVQHSLEKSFAQVEQQLREKAASDGSIDTQVFYTRFRAAALNYKAMLSLLHQRRDVHEDYTRTLEELEAFYVHLRLRLIAGPVTGHLQGVLRRDLRLDELAPATRQASSYILEISNLEQQAFEGYFEQRPGQDALKTLLDRVADIFYQALRPVVIVCDSIESLREMADCLQMDILEPQQQGSKKNIMPVLAVVYRLHKDVQERLIFCVENFIRAEIKGYQVASADLDYPNMLFDSVPSDAEAAASEDMGAHSAIALKQGWFPTMRRTLGILEKIYRVLEMSTFQGLAQEAVDLCIASLRVASGSLARRYISARNTPPALVALTQAMDSQLFMVRHLLSLREHIAAFECDLVANERYFNFANVWEALHLKLPDGLLGILKPTVSYSQVDSKKDIEAELKMACEGLIATVTTHISQPLASLNGHIGDYLARPQVDRATLRQQPFMSNEALHEAVGAFLDNVRQRVPFVAAHIRLYVSTEGGNAHSEESGNAQATSAAVATGVGTGTGTGTGTGMGPSTSSSGQGQTTASILFKPVEMRLVDTWGRLESLLEDLEVADSDLQAIGILSQSALRELISSLFDCTMSSTWPQLVELVNGVPRSAVNVSIAGAGGGMMTPRPSSQTPLPAAGLEAAVAQAQTHGGGAPASAAAAVAAAAPAEQVSSEIETAPSASTSPPVPMV